MTDTRKKILLFEDDGFTRFMMQEIRDTLGVAIDISSTLQDGFVRYRNDPNAYGVVLMDIHMQGDRGLEVGQTLRGFPEASGLDVPIIAVTSDERFLDDGVLSSYGINGHIRKPLTPGEVMALIDQYC